MPDQLRIFVPSAATLLTDHRGHGEGLIAWSMLSALAARGHRVVACARQIDLRADAPFEVVEMGLASRRESIEPIAYAMRVARVYARLGGGRHFDVVHWLFPQGRHEVLVAPKGARFVVGPHALPWPGRPHARRGGDLVRAAAEPLFRALHMRALARAAVLLVATPDAAAIFPTSFRSKVRVLPFGIDDSQVAASPGPALEPRIAFIGRLEQAKGGAKLVQAFARVKNEIPEATLVLAGDGPERATLERLGARLRLGDSVQFLGSIPHDRVGDVLDSAAVLCVPSDREPYGMAVLEAMAAGRAVVARDEGGPRFLLAHTQDDQLVPGSDADSLADALTRLLSNKERLARIGAQNRDVVASRFTLTRVIDELESIYEAAT